MTIVIQTEGSVNFINDHLRLNMLRFLDWNAMISHRSYFLSQAFLLDVAKPHLSYDPKELHVRYQTKDSVVSISLLIVKEC